MDLSLTAAETEHLGALGVTVGADGTMRSASGNEVGPATAVALLAKSAVSPADFRRPYLRQGHAAENAGQWTVGIPGSAQSRTARPGPAGPPGPAGSGTADRSMDGSSAGAGDEDDDMVAGRDVDGSGAGAPAEMAKMVPGQFHRPFLSAGHAAESPAVTGRRATTPVPSADPVEHRDFTRGCLTAGHASPPPDDQPADNPHYEGAVRVYAANRAAERGEHIMFSQAVTSMPANGRLALPQDMHASLVPHQISVSASKPAPGEQR